MGTLPPRKAEPGMSDAAVAAATGRDWDGWFALLDGDGAAAMGHPAIVRHLQTTYGVSDWWCQMVTVGYERARGLRAVHEKADGYAANASKTLAADAETVTAWFSDAGLQARWLEPGTVTLRSTTPGKSARFDVAAGGRMSVWVTAKGEAKSGVSLQHERLPDAEAVAMWKSFWKERLEVLAAELQAGNDA